MSDNPVIGKAVWVPGGRPGSVHQVAPERCPFEGHDLTAPGSLGSGWDPDDGGLRLYTCWACYRKNPQRAMWRVARDDDAMWRASGLPKPPERRAKYQGI